jgi:polysaccharide biosynthesis protein PslG
MSAWGSKNLRFRGVSRVLTLFVSVMALMVAAVPAANATIARPVLTVSGTTLSWGALSGVNSYLLATIRNPTTTRDTTYQAVTGTSFKPPAVPGQSVKYGLRANVTAAPWSVEVTINWPVPPPPKPVLTVSGTTLKWGALSGITSYRLATIRNPTTTRDTTYQTVTGTSFSPPSVPGESVNYGLRADVSGAPWGAEVTINWPVPPPPRPVLTVSGTTINWGALSGVSSYVLATIRNPTTTRDTTYQTVTGTSFSPPSVPGESVGYGLSANVSGAPWASEVTIDWPANTAGSTVVSGTTTTTTTTSTSTTSAAAPASSGGVSGGLDVGLNTDIGGWGTSQAQRMNQIENQTATKWIREAFDWSQIEPQNGSYDFSNYDTLVTLAAQNGVHILANLLSAPSWAAATWNTIPSDPSAYASFVATVVSRYGPHGSFWTNHPTLTKDPITTYELLNEPYYDNGDNGDYNPGRYARLIKAAGAAGHTADPSAQFLLAAENQSQLVSGTWTWWIDALYQAVPDLNTYYDGIAVHPYGTDLTSASFPGYDQIRRVESIHQQFSTHNAADKPLWITEIGWPTCTNGGSDRCTTATGQANDLTTVFNYARGSWKSYVQAVFIYGYQDNDPNSADPENDYGIVANDGTPKPALSVFKTQLALP